GLGELPVALVVEEEGVLIEAMEGTDDRLDDDFARGLGPGPGPTMRVRRGRGGRGGQVGAEIAGAHGLRPASGSWFTRGEVLVRTTDPPCRPATDRLLAYGPRADSQGPSRAVGPFGSGAVVRAPGPGLARLGDVGSRRGQLRGQEAGP